MLKMTQMSDPGQVVALVNKLSLTDKIRVFRKLEQETWAKRLDEIVLKIRKSFKKNSISDKEITRICEETRQKLYNERIKSRH